MFVYIRYFNIKWRILKWQITYIGAEVSVFVVKGDLRYFETCLTFCLKVSNVRIFKWTEHQFLIMSAELWTKSCTSIFITIDILSNVIIYSEQIPFVTSNPWLLSKNYFKFLVLGLFGFDKSQWEIICDMSLCET